MRRSVFESGVRRSRAGVAEEIVAEIETPSSTARVKADVRERCADDFNENRRVAVEIINSDSSSNTDKLRALDLLGKYGGLQQIDSTSGDAPVKVRNIAEDLPQELLDQIEAFLRR